MKRNHRTRPTFDTSKKTVETPLHPVSTESDPSHRLLYESHMHTPLCKHASGHPSDYAAVAEKRGLRGIIVTCHSPLPGGYSADVRMTPEQFPAYQALVADAADEWAGRQDVLLGLESDYVPGLEDWIGELHEKAEFHHVLGSVHPQIREYRERYFDGDAVAFQRTYFTHLAEAAETGLYDTLAHPDLIKNETATAWDLDISMPFIREALDRIAASGCAMELNTSGLMKRIPEMNPGREILAEIHSRGIPVVLGADAHVPRRAGDRFIEALGILQETGFTHVSGFRNRERFDVPIKEALASLRAAGQPS